MTDISPDELNFIEDMGLIIEHSGGSKTLGRIFGYLLLADQPKPLDEIAKDLFFSKATASLTIRQGLLTSFFEKVSIPGNRKDFYKVDTKVWVNVMSRKINSLDHWERLINKGLDLLQQDRKSAKENLEVMKDYFVFMRWYLSDLTEQYERWKSGEIKKTPK